MLIYDLGSSHGTFLNKQFIQKKAYVKINVGDIFTLGKSRKSFILHGPELITNETDVQVDFSKLVNKQEIIEGRKRFMAAQYKSSLEEKVNWQNKDISWGIRDDDEEVYREAKEQEDDLFDGELDLEKLRERGINGKQQKLVDNLTSLRKQIANVDRQLSELKEKSGEMTDGMLRKYNELCLKKESLAEKYETNEDNLRMSLSIKETEQRFDWKKVREFNDEEEIMEDRGEARREERKVENYESIKAKLEYLHKEKQNVVNQIEELDDKSKSKVDAEDDALEIFMRNNLENLNKDVREKLRGRLKEIVAEIEG